MYVRFAILASGFILCELTLGFSATYFAQFLISRIASILVSGKAALHANSDRHFTASWNESMMEAKCFSHMLAANVE